MEEEKTLENEKNRLEALLSYEILGSSQEEIFDNITKIAAEICEAPISLISLVDTDRAWFKSKIGMEADSTPREISFCKHAINHQGLFVVEDATKDERFLNNPLVTGESKIVFYAGAPIVDEKGFTLGELCVVDHKPRALSTKQLKMLERLSSATMYIIKNRLEVLKKDLSYSTLLKLAEHLPGCIYTFKITPDGKSSIPYSSSHICELFEVSQEEIKKDASIIFSRIHPDDSDYFSQLINESRKTLSHWRCKCRIILPSGIEKWISGNSNPELLSDGSVLWHGYVEDITEIKIQEADLARSSRLATMGQMAAGIAHEINNPLAIINMSTQQVLSDAHRGELNTNRVLKNIERIKETTERISKIVRGLKFVSRLTLNDEFEEVSVGKIIDETISMCEEKFKIANIKLIMDFPRDIKKEIIQCRPVEISQVLLNLFNNAFDAIETNIDPWVSLTIKLKNENILFIVKDCGLGIKQEEVDKILAPFFTTKLAGKGTGLGLSISQKLIEGHSGRLWIDTTSKNTSFNFEFPKKIQTELKK